MNTKEKVISDLSERIAKNLVKNFSVKGRPCDLMEEGMAKLIEGIILLLESQPDASEHGARSTALKRSDENVERSEKNSEYQRRRYDQDERDNPMDALAEFVKSLGYYGGAEIALKTMQALTRPPDPH